MNSAQRIATILVVSAMGGGPTYAAPPEPPGAERLAAERGCFTCHREANAPPTAMQALPSAPSFRDIAMRYRHRDRAQEILTPIVIQGSDPAKRHWANNAAFASMLPNTTEVTAEEASALVRWILSLAP